MIITNLKISIRGIFKNKTQSVISIFGLGIGLGCVFLLALLYIHENSFDRYMPNHQQLYRVIRGTDCRTSFPLAKIAKDEIPLIDGYFRFYQTQELEIKNKNNEIFKDERLACADASVFDCLGIRFIVGMPASSKMEIAISESMAQKYFSTANPTGQTIQIRLSDQFIPLTVSGVFRNFPSTSSLNPNFIADMEFTDEVLGKNKQLLGQYGDGSDGFRSNWDYCTISTYLLLNKKANTNEVIERLQKYNELVEDKNRKQLAYNLQPISDIYLKSGDMLGNLFTRQGDANELKYYVGIAILILVIAIFNYIFLTKAKTETRLKEIGSKKALGATRNSLRKQILLESNLMSFLSLAPAFFVVALGIPFINSTLSRTLDLSVFSMWQVWLLFVVVLFLTGTFSGLLTGINISRVSPVLLLQGKTTLKPRYNRWSNSFLSLHFAIFILLISGVLTLKKQINFALNNFQSIDTKNIVICELNSSELSSQFNVIKNEIDKIPGVLKTAGSSFIPPFNYFLPVKLQYEEEKIAFDGLIMGEGMIELLDLELIEGEPFGDYKTERREMIFNESAALKYNLKAGELFNGFYVKGIVKDFNGHSLHRLIQPMVILQQHPQKMGLFAIKTDGKNDAAITMAIHKLFKQISPNKIVTTYSLTDQISQFYTHEQNQAKLISAFSLLAIVLSIMGLLGMTLNTIARKTKEIGIRKVNGAKISEVLGMLNLIFLKWVMVAIIIAIPVTYYAMNKWLENFAYKTTLSWWIFVLAGVLALVIALLTVSWQSWRAATRNPVEALRYE